MCFMLSLKKQITLAIVAIVGFCLITFLLVQSFRLIGPDPIFLKNYRASLLFLFSVVITLSWISMGMVGGVIFLALSSIVTLLSSISSNVFDYNLQLLLYLGFGGLLAHFSGKVKRANRLDEVELEVSEEARRALALEYERRKVKIEGLRKRFQRYSTLKDVTEVLSSGLSLQGVVRLVVNQTFQLIGKGENCLLFLVEEGGRKLALVAQEGAKELPELKLEKGDIFNYWVLKQKQPLVITDIQKDFRFSLDEVDGNMRRWRSLMIAPVISKERIIGLLRMNAQKPDTFAADDLRFLDIISGLASVAIENALLYEKTEELAIKDGLTGLCVHRYFIQRLQEEHERAKLTKTNLSLLMCDLDYFKSYNDRYGHTAGDILLRRLAEILMDSTKDSTLVARYGGEEFTVILPGVEKKEALKIAEDIRKKVESEMFIIRRVSTRITISIGVVTFPIDAQTPEELIGTADSAMYRAKRQGRNQVCEA